MGIQRCFSEKKDGSFRLCVDYRRLNSVTYKNSYPLPHIDRCLGSMNGAVWFSTLDLRSGYHNIPIREDYDSLFSRGILDMGRTTLVEHTIDTRKNLDESLK